MPIEPSPTSWSMPAPDDLDDADELVAVGADLEPGTLLAAYRAGLFPMPLPDDVPKGFTKGASIGWWSPDPRGVLPLDGLHVSSSLRRSLRKFEVRVDTAFESVIRACGDPARPHGWINAEIMTAYKRLYDLGWVHSVEVWNVQTGALAGGLYGLAIGGLFAAESKFHWETDASKAAVVALVHLLEEHSFSLIDVQWRTDHLATLGVVDISRRDYLRHLRSALELRTQPLGALQQGRRFESFAHVGK